jgi:hypothetical protein
MHARTSDHEFSLEEKIDQTPRNNAFNKITPLERRHCQVELTNVGSWDFTPEIRDLTLKKHHHTKDAMRYCCWFIDTQKQHALA